MPFEIIQTRIMETSREFSPVRIAIHETPRNGKEATFAIEFVIGAELCKKLGWNPGKCRVQVAEGTGPDEGIIQLQLNATGVAVGRQTGKAGNAVIRVPVVQFKHLRFRMVKSSVRPATFQSLGSSLLVMVSEFVE